MRIGAGADSGSGLGLHIVYKLVTTTLHGSVEASSSDGAGACFTVMLPLSAPAPMRKPDRAPPAVAIL